MHIWQIIAALSAVQAPCHHRPGCYPGPFIQCSVNCLFRFCFSCWCCPALKVILLSLPFNLIWLSYRWCCGPQPSSFPRRVLRLMTWQPLCLCPCVLCGLCLLFGCVFKCTCEYISGLKQCQAVKVTSNKTLTLQPLLFHMAEQNSQIVSYDDT